MRKTLAKVRDVTDGSSKEHGLMALAYGGAGYVGHNYTVLICLAYLTLFVLHVHMVLRAKRIRASEAADQGEQA